MSAAVNRFADLLETLDMSVQVRAENECVRRHIAEVRNSLTAWERERLILFLLYGVAARPENLQ